MGLGLTEASCSCPGKCPDDDAKESFPRARTEPVDCAGTFVEPKNAEETGSALCWASEGADTSACADSVGMPAPGSVLFPHSSDADAYDCGASSSPRPPNSAVNVASSCGACSDGSPPLRKSGPADPKRPDAVSPSSASACGCACSAFAPPNGRSAAGEPASAVSLGTSLVITGASARFGGALRPARGGVAPLAIGAGCSSTLRLWASWCLRSFTVRP